MVKIVHELLYFLFIMTYNITTTLRTARVLQQIYHLVSRNHLKVNFIHVIVRNENKIITITIKSNEDCLTFPSIPIGVVQRLIRNSELACEMM